MLKKFCLSHRSIIGSTVGISNGFTSWEAISKGVVMPLNSIFSKSTSMLSVQNITPSASLSDEGLTTSFSLFGTQKRFYPKKKPVLILKDFGDSLFEGDIAIVAPGYMRNCLYPKGVAQYPTAENVKKFEKEKRTPELLNRVEEKKKGLKIRKRLKKFGMLTMKREARGTPIIVEGAVQYQLISPITKADFSREILELFKFKIPEDGIIMDTERFPKGIDETGYFEISLQISQYDQHVMKVRVVRPGDAS